MSYGLKVLISTKFGLLHRCATWIFWNVHKNTGEEMFTKYLSADSCFVKAIILLAVMITTMQLKLKMNPCTALTETNFCNLSRPCRNSHCFQKMVQSFNFTWIIVARIIVQHFTEESRQTTIRVCTKVFLKEEILLHYQNSWSFFNFWCFKHFLIETKWLVPCIFELTVYTVLKNQCLKFFIGSAKCKDKWI